MLSKERHQTATGPSLAAVPGFEVTAPIQLVRRGAELRIVLAGASMPSRTPDAQLMKTVIEARCRVADWIDHGGRLTIRDLARRDGVHIADVSRSLQLSFLAPDIVEAIFEGSQPMELTSERLKRIGELPLSWDEQRALIG